MASSGSRATPVRSSSFPLYDLLTPGSCRSGLMDSAVPPTCRCAPDPEPQDWRVEVRQAPRCDADGQRLRCLVVLDRRIRPKHHPPVGIQAYSCTIFAHSPIASPHHRRIRSTLIGSVCCTSPGKQHLLIARYASESALYRPNNYVRLETIKDSPVLQREGFTQNSFEKDGNSVPTMEGALVSLLTFTRPG